MKPTLIIMAAGMGSRYGGLKQLDPLGPSGETIMDYSIHDTIAAGFGKVVFVIRKAFAEQFEQQILSKYQGKITTEVVYQEPDKLPSGFSVPAERVKPWGTNHALMMAREVVREPFAVINADDFYGKEAFAAMAQYLQNLPQDAQGQYCMVAYYLGNTMSRSGSVSRGVCSTFPDRHLASITEHKTISYADTHSQQIISETDGTTMELDSRSLVSMNMWGFTPDYFDHSDRLFVDFLRANIGNLKSEFYIPSVVDQLIQSGKATVEVLETSSSWFGVTYPEDRPYVVDRFRNLVQQGVYPTPLFSK